MRYDKDGDEHYDLMSAFQKSMRGSDPDAAVHYLGRLLEAGDLPSAVPAAAGLRLRGCGACLAPDHPRGEGGGGFRFDGGLAGGPHSSGGRGGSGGFGAQVQFRIQGFGRRSCRYSGGKGGACSPQPANKHYDSAEVERKGQFYQYPHDAPHHWLPQQYLPDSLLGAHYFDYGTSKTEQSFRAYWDKIKHKPGGKSCMMD